MCLTQITNWQMADEGVGYKVYHEFEKEGVLRSAVTNDVVIENEWMKAEEKNVPKLGRNLVYSKGFHIVENSRLPSGGTWDFALPGFKPDPPEAKVKMRKVRYRKVICSGTQNDGRIPVIVADEIMVIDKRKLPKPEVIEEVFINK